MTTEWTDAIGGFADWMLAGGASAGTVRLRSNYLTRLAKSSEKGPWDLGLADLLRFLASHQWQPETRKAARSSLRGFYRYAMTLGLTDHDPSALLPAVKIPQAEPRPAPEDVIRRALEQATPRERLMVLLGAVQGLRRAEIARVHTRDLVDDTLTVVGKGGKMRCVPLCTELLEALRSAPDGYLFPAQVGGFTNWRPDYTRHLSPDRVGRILSALLGCPGHRLRHRMSGFAFGAERDFVTLTRLMGWSRPETAMRYTVTPDGAMRTAVLAASL